MAEETGTVVKAIDMANDMATACMGFATAAVEQFQMEKDMAGMLRNKGSIKTSCESRGPKH